MSRVSIRTALRIRRPLAFFLALGLLGGRAGAVATEDPESLLAAADRARHDQQLPEAVELYRRIVVDWPDEQRGWWFLCTTLYDLQRWTEAGEAAIGLTSRWPEYGPGHAMLGLSLLRMGEYSRALESLQQARIAGLGENPALQRIVRYHGAILLNRLGLFEGAFQALKGFAYADQRSPSIVEAYGLAMLRMPYLPWEIPDQRRDLVRQVGEAAWDWEVGRRDQARDLFARILAEHPDEPNLRYSYGALLLQVDPDSALRQFLRDLEVNPANLPALAQVALEYIRRGQFELAMPFARRAVQVDPASPVAQFALGQVLLETGSLPEAVQRLERAASLAPLKPEIHFVLGRAYQRSGRPEDARRHFLEFERLNRMLKEAEEFLSRDGG